mmetsp:Transcript_3943/g.11151  ORF Transcript_3943/g.11151 Transcript_3943/m.11151 type:complete len:278 (-) Transcript_3943:2635-3468(-)
MCKRKCIHVPQNCGLGLHWMRGVVAVDGCHVHGALNCIKGALDVRLADAFALVHDDEGVDVWAGDVELLLDKLFGTAVILADARELAHSAPQDLYKWRAQHSVFIHCRHEVACPDILCPRLVHVRLLRVAAGLAVGMLLDGVVEDAAHEGGLSPRAQRAVAQRLVEPVEDDLVHLRGVLLLAKLETAVENADCLLKDFCRGGRGPMALHLRIEALKNLRHRAEHAVLGASLALVSHALLEEGLAEAVNAPEHLNDHVDKARVGASSIEERAHFRNEG